MPTNPSPSDVPAKAFLNAGGGSAKDARGALVKAGFDVEDVQPDKLEERLKRAITDGAKRLVVAGGDGTIGTAASLVAKTDVELGVLPAGTLNHFAKDHDIPEDLAEAAEVARSGRVEGADLGYLHNSVFLNTSSIGAYVTFVRVRDRFEKAFGYKIASFIALLRMFSTLRTFSVELEVDGEKKSYRTPLVFIGVGEREFQPPELGSRVANGERALHVMVVRGRKPARLLAIALAGVSRGIAYADRLPEFDTFLVDSCRVELTRPSATVAMDGELKGMEAPFEYRIERDAIRLVVPAATTG